MDVFEALADPVRRDLLRRVAAGPVRVSDLGAAHPISRPAISRHLRVLRESGLVSSTSTGRERHHELVRTALAPVHELLAELTGGAAPFTEAHLAGLDLEVRRVGRERRSTPDETDHTEETA